MQNNDNDILERLKHPEREPERRRTGRNLFLRNVLNAVFMIMAVAAMVGIAVNWDSREDAMWCYILGLLAVVVKMAEALLRMPDLLKNLSSRERDTDKNNSRLPE